MNNAQTELSVGCGLKLRAFALAVAACLVAGTASANPTGATVTSGSAAISSAGSTLSVTNTPNTIINWHNFSINPGETTQFIQQSAASAVLNRITGGDPSLILGTLQSNGRVFLINPSGIIFGAGSVVNVAGLVASTLNITDADFLAGKHIYNANIANPGNVTNAGEIHTPTGGFVYLIGTKVENTGVITTPSGEAILAAGNSVEVVDSTDPSQHVLVSAQSQDVNLSQLMLQNDGNIFGVLNSGRVSANTVTQDASGRIYFKSAGNIETTADSIIEAKGTGTLDGGHIQASAGLDGIYQGTVTADGTTGGTIEVLGNHVGIMDGASVTANGTQNGGTVLIGGDYQGKNPDVPNAQVTYIASSASISADGGVSSPGEGGSGWGNGGKVIVWADDTTRAYGTISARGGANGGNGGFIETSAHRYLDVEGIRINAAAPSGQAGTWLLDPNDVTIVHDTSATSDANISQGRIFDFSPTLDTANSVISDFTLNAAISSGTSVSLTTAPTGTAGNGDILFDPSVGGAITLSNSIGTTFSTTLTLNADRDIRFLSGTTNLQTLSTTQGMTVAFNPGTGGSGGVFTNAGATVNLSGDRLVAQVINGKTWQNDGTINRDSGSVGSSILLFDGVSLYSTFQNNGVLNINSGGGWSFLSNSGTQDGIVNNAGTINVNASTSWEALFTNQPGGTLNIANGNTLSMQNADTLGGTINIGTGATLWLSEQHSGARTFSGATINDAGTLALNSGFSPLPLPTTFSNTTLSYTGDFTIPTDINITYTGNIGYSATGNLLLSSSSFNTTNNINLAAGSFTANNSTIGAGGNLVLNAGVASLTGSLISVSGSAQINVGGALSLNSSEISSTGNLNINVGSLTEMSSSISNPQFSGSNITLNSTGDITLTDSDIAADKEVHVQTTNGKIYLNTLGLDSSAGESHISTYSNNTIFLNFPTLFSGGFVLDGIEGIFISPYNPFTGFFTGPNLDIPAILNTNLFITYGLVAPAGATAGAITSVVSQNNTNTLATNSYIDAYGPNQTGPGDSSLTYGVIGNPRVFGEVRECS